MEFKAVVPFKLPRFVWAMEIIIVLLCILKVLEKHDLKVEILRSRYELEKKSSAYFHSLPGIF